MSATITMTSRLRRLVGKLPRHRRLYLAAFVFGVYCPSVSEKDNNMAGMFFYATDPLEG